jgi:hypothetical protein
MDFKKRPVFGRCPQSEIVTAIQKQSHSELGWEEEFYDQRESL